MLKSLIALFAEKFFDKRLNENKTWVPQQLVPDNNRSISLPFPYGSTIQSYTPPQDGVFVFGCSTKSGYKNYLECNENGRYFNLDCPQASYLSFTMPVHKGLNFSYKMSATEAQIENFHVCAFIPYKSSSS